MKNPLLDDAGRRVGIVGATTGVIDPQTLEARLRSRLGRLEWLEAITTAISAQGDICDVYQVALDHLEARLPIDWCCVCRVDTVHDAFVLAQIGARSRRLASHCGLTEDARFCGDSPELERAARDVLVYEPDTGNATSPLLRRLADAGLRSLVIAPMASEQRVFGLLLVARGARRDYNQDDREFLHQLAAHIALAASQAQMRGALERAQEELRQTRQSVMQQERLRALGQMASGIAHDINNAIAPVALYAETLLESECTLSDRGRRRLAAISRAIDDVAATVARMRDFYRQRSEPQVMGPVELNPLVQQVAELTRARWSDIPQQRGIVIELQTELAEDLPLVLGVESELRDALINLVLNAVDAMPDGGELTLRTRGGVMLDADDRESPSVLVDVVDTGIGMGPNTRMHCLEPFFTTKGERGTGLGLAMVYGMMQRHHGSVEIESEVGAGTTVSLNFPRASAGTTVHVASIAASRPVPRLKLLVVDDDPIMRRSLGDTLEFDGHFVVAADGGQRGIDTYREHLRSQPFDLVVTDLGMPYVDGRRVAAAIKALRPGTPVIMLTGWGERMLATADVPPHVDLLLGKPIRPHELRAALGRLIHPLASMAASP